MKKFSEYLTESNKTYKFIVRIAGDLPEQCDESLNTCLGRFQCVNVSKPKRTPIQETPMDFPTLRNTEVHTWEVEIKYPTTKQVMQEYIAQHCGVQNSHVNVRAEGDPVEADHQEAAKNEPYESVLQTEDMGGESAQDAVGENRVMDLLKELETARKERDTDPTADTPTGESKDIGDSQNTKAVVGG